MTKSRLKAGNVKLTYLLFLLFVSPSPAYSDDLKNWIDSNGHMELHFYPPHNEYDPNPGIPFSERVVARYGLEIYSEFRYPKFPKLFLFLHPFALFGDSRPQISYNYEANPIVVQIKYGAGFEIFRNLELRTTHSEWKDLGGYKSERLIWNSVSLRYKW